MDTRNQTWADREIIREAERVRLRKLLFKDFRLPDGSRMQLEARKRSESRQGGGGSGGGGMVGGIGASALLIILALVVAVVLLVAFVRRRRALQWKVEVIAPEKPTRKQVVQKILVVDQGAAIELVAAMSSDLQKNGAEPVRPSDLYGVS